MKKVTLTVPWGQYDPILKKQNKSTVYYNDFFLQIIFYNTGLYSYIDKYTRLCLGTFEYIEADREIYKKWITKSKEYCTTLHVWVSDYFTYSIIVYRSHFYSWHWLHNHLLCCALRTQSYCTHYRWIWFSFPLIWDKRSISCAVMNDAGWCL